MGRLEELKVQVHAESKAAAQAQVEKEVKKTLEAERAAHMETLTNSIVKERMKTGDQRLKVQLYVSQHLWLMEFLSKCKVISSLMASFSLGTYLSGWR